MVRKPPASRLSLATCGRLYLCCYEHALSTRRSMESKAIEKSVRFMRNRHLAQDCLSLN